MLKKIKTIREKTGAGMVDIKKALVAANGDEEKAIELLRKSGQAKAVKKSERTAKEGIVASYIHSNNRIGVMIKLFCETDFVARNSDFQELAKDICMHIAGMNPKFLKPEDVSLKLVDKEKEIWTEQLKNEGKLETMLEKIMAGKEKKFREESALLTQSFVKNSDITVGELIAEKIGIIGENIQVGEFVRYEL
ncbi:MAG: translation elongation factor Ts [Parcubacteria group bacterium]|jgi:elongation factor Ts